MFERRIKKSQTTGIGGKLRDYWTVEELQPCYCPAVDGDHWGHWNRIAGTPIKAEAELIKRKVPQNLVGE